MRLGIGRVGRRSAWAGLASAALLLGFSAWDPSDAPDPSDGRQAPAKVLGAGDGMVVVRDAETNRLRPPTPEEWREMSKDLGFRRTPKEPVVERLPGGALTFVTDESWDDALVATRTEDGIRAVRCATAGDADGAKRPAASALVGGTSEH